MSCEASVALFLEEGVSVDGNRSSWVCSKLALNLNSLVLPPGFPMLGSANGVLTDNIDLLSYNSLVKI